MDRLVTPLELRPFGRLFRVRLLTHRRAPGAQTLAERLPGGVSQGTPSDQATYPYGVFRFLNVRETPDQGDPRWQGSVELFVFHGSRAEADALEETTDMGVAALVSYRDLDRGVHRVRLADRDTMPPFTERSDPEVIQTRTVFDILLVPNPGV